MSVEQQNVASTGNLQDLPKLVRTIAKMLHVNVEETEDFFVFRPLGYSGEGNDVIAPLAKNAVMELLESAQKRKTEDPARLTSEEYLEYLVEVDRHSIASRNLRGDGLSAEDAGSGLKFRVGQPTNEFLLHVIENFLSDLPSRKWRLFGTLNHSMRIDLYKRASELTQTDFALPNEKLNVFDLLRRSIPITTLQVTSSTNRSPKDLQALAEGYLFQLSYNLDIALIPQRRLDTLARPERISQMRRSDPKHVDAPRRTYVSDLIYHYQLGVSTDGGVLAFLSFYHVLEHWFESVYNDDLVGNIQHLITGPKFSYTKRTDIMSVISEVTKAVKERGEEYKIDELSALKLTLEKYLNLRDLLGDLKAFDPALVSHFRTTKVSFSNGDLVNLESTDELNLRRSLANRIYKTRNALVHSKDGTKSRFVPFKDDKDLEPEVNLLRFIAEQVIIHSSTMRRD